MQTEEIWTAELAGWLKDEARSVGFDRAGIAAVAGLEAEAEARDAERFASWIEQGRAGEMEYLKRRDAEGQLLRSTVRVPMAWARSVVVCAVSYGARGPLSIDAADRSQGWIARYAWSGRDEGAEDGMRATDYHVELLERLRELERRLRDRVGCESRCYVDTGPLVERSLAARAGVGWIGKNTCVLDQELGSWLLLATIVTSIGCEGAWSEVASADRCGSCTRCIDACPTDALVAERAMDASRCIAYLTIEKKGSIAAELRAGMGRQIFGCDICQDVCPWNRRAPVFARAGMEPRPEMVNPELEAIAAMESKDFRRVFGGSPLERTGRKRLQRNVAIAMGNSGDARFAERLERWSHGEDPVLAETAQWAQERLRLSSEGAALAGVAEAGTPPERPLCSASIDCNTVSERS